MLRLIAKLSVMLLLSGCMQRGVDLPETGQKSWFKDHSLGNFFHSSHDTNTKKQVIHNEDANHTNSIPIDNPFDTEDSNISQTKKDQNLSRKNEQKRSMPFTRDTQKEFSKTFRIIPFVGEIQKLIPSTNEIPVINKISRSFLKSSGNSTHRLKRDNSLTTPINNKRSKASMDQYSTLYGYTQHFSGGLHYNEEIFLKKIKTKTNKDQHTIVKFICTNISPYVVEYDPKKKIIVVMLNEYTSKMGKIKVTLPKRSIINESRIEYLPNKIKIILQLKQDAKIDVLESYGPTYISIDITPMYRLYIGNPS